MSVEAVLLDLDGTLADTAPDLVRVLNHLLIAEGLPRMPYAIARNEVSNGASGLLRLGFGEQQTEAELETRRARFLGRLRRKYLRRISAFHRYRRLSLIKKTIFAGAS